MIILVMRVRAADALVPRRTVTENVETDAPKATGVRVKFQATAAANKPIPGMEWKDRKEKSWLNYWKEKLQS